MRRGRAARTGDRIRDRIRDGAGDRTGDRAVSTVLGAVLMFGLFVVTLVVVQVRFVPVWDEDRQAAHMAVLADELAVIKSDLDRQAGNASAAALTDPLTLGSAGGFRFLSTPSDEQAELAFTPAPPGTGITVASPRLRLQVRGGLNLFGLDEQWTAVTTGGTVTDILRVDHLRLRVDMSPTYDDGDSAQLTVTGEDGSFAGRVVVTFHEFPSEDALEVKVYGPANTEISSDAEAFFQQTALEFFYFDLLDPGLLVRDVLAAADPPFAISMVNSGLQADYTIAYASGALGGGLVGAGGIAIRNYTGTQASGRLAVVARNDAFVDQSYTLEHGAVLLRQPDGAAMAVPPQITVVATPSGVFVDWLVPGLAGGAAAFGGSRAASVLLQPAGVPTDFTAAAGAINFTLPTAHGDVWAAHLDGLLSAAGLVGSGTQPEYRVTANATHVRMELFGPVAAPGDATEDLAVRFRQAVIAVQIRPSG